ncbi:MAG: helicase-related protein, partial [Beijerinckiaceae bacterium]
RDIATVAKSLEKHGFNVGGLHGDMEQRARMATLDAFRAGRVPLLVASDVAARGLDIPDVSHVINFDVPIHADDYVHRIGRTGRAGRTGTALMIVAASDTRYLEAITSLLKKDIPWHGADLANLPASEAPPEERSYGRRPERGGERGAKGARGKRDGEDKRRSPETERAPDTERAPKAARSVEPAARALPPEMRAAPAAEPKARRFESSADGPTPKGLGDHVPSFMMRPVARKAR